jgi:hypothetical protein
MRADMAIDSKPNPYVLGFSIGVGLALAILVSVLWIPWVWDAKYKQLRDFLFFSVGFFIILIRRYGRGCWVPRFWLALAILHSLTQWVAGYWVSCCHLKASSPNPMLHPIAPKQCRCQRFRKVN